MREEDETQRRLMKVVTEILQLCYDDRAWEPLNDQIGQLKQIIDLQEGRGDSESKIETLLDVQVVCCLSDLVSLSRMDILMHSILLANCTLVFQSLAIPQVKDPELKNYFRIRLKVFNSVADRGITALHMSALKCMM